MVEALAKAGPREDVRFAVTDGERARSFRATRRPRGEAAKRAGQFTVVTPSQWTDGDDFVAADRMLPNLGDAGHPLPLADAARGRVASTRLDRDQTRAPPPRDNRAMELLVA